MTVTAVLALTDGRSWDGNHTAVPKNSFVQVMKKAHDQFEFFAFLDTRTETANKKANGQVFDRIVCPIKSHQRPNHHRHFRSSTTTTTAVSLQLPFFSDNIA